jgi:hypothetical protein
MVMIAPERFGVVFGRSAVTETWHQYVPPVEIRQPVSLAAAKKIKIK